MTSALASVIAAAIMRERATIERALQHAGVASGDVEDVCQDVVVLALAAAQEERVAWRRRGTLTRWLYVVALRHGRAYVQRAEVRARYEGTHEHEPIAPSAEELYLRRETLALAARSTTPERWRVLRAWASGVEVADIARCERIAVPTVYNRIRLARVDIHVALIRDDRYRAAVHQPSNASKRSPGSTRRSGCASHSSGGRS